MKDVSCAAVRASAVTLLLDIFLSALKMTVAFLSGSSAMLSDAVHSAADVLSSVVVLAGVHFSRRTADARHPYGYEKLESLAALTLSVVLLGTGVVIGRNGVRAVLAGTQGEYSVPGGIAMYAALLSMALKEGMYWYTRGVAVKVHSSAMHASAWHHRSDALASLGSFVGVLGARMGFPLLDPIMSLVICLLILHVALRIGKGAVANLTDCACPTDVEKDMRALVRAQSGVVSLDSLKTRLFGNRVCVDVTIGADSAQTLRSAHDVAAEVRRALMESFPEVKSCMVHVNPRNAEE